MSEPPAKPEKKTSTLTIVLAVVGGGLLLMMIAGGLAIYAVLSSPRGRAVVGVMGEAVRLSAKAQKAPGTKELRAMGCKQAMVFDVEDLSKMMGHLDAAPPSQDTAPYGEMVVCSLNPWGTAPACDDVASKYVSAVGARPKRFVVSVQHAGTGKAVCAHFYDEAGKLMSDLDARSAPVPPVPE